MIKSRIILILAAVLIVSAVFTGWASINDLIKGTISNSLIGAARGALGIIVEQIPSWYFYSLAIIYFIISIIAFVSGIGLLLAKEWARKGVFIIAFSSVSLKLINLIALTLLNLFPQFINSLFDFFISLLFYSITIHFLTKKEIKKEFRA